MREIEVSLSNPLLHNVERIAPYNNFFMCPAALYIYIYIKGSKNCPYSIACQLNSQQHKAGKDKKNIEDYLKGKESQIPRMFQEREVRGFMACFLYWQRENHEFHYV
jgi:hypothetical protein